MEVDGIRAGICQLSGATPGVEGQGHLLLIRDPFWTVSACSSVVVVVAATIDPYTWTPVEQEGNAFRSSNGG